MNRNPNTFVALGQATRHERLDARLLAGVAGMIAGDMAEQRSAMLSLQPTTTGRATATALILAELKGKLNGHAVRAHDTRSSIVDGLSTLVTDGTMLKVYAWYDNEMGYACRMVDLACIMEKAGL